MAEIPKLVYQSLPRQLPLSFGFSLYSLLLDGVEDYIEVPHSTGLDIGNASYSAEVWVKTSYLADYQVLFNKRQSGDTVWPLHFIIRPDDGRLYADITPEVRITGSTNVADGFWHHVVFVRDFDAGLLHLYVDGVEDVDPVAEAAGDVRSSADLWLGRYFHPSYPRVLNGLMDMPRVYNRALSLQEIRHNMLNYHDPICSGLVLWLPFEEGSGLTAHDKSGYGNDGSLLPADDPPVWRRNLMWELRSEGGL